MKISFRIGLCAFLLLAATRAIALECVFGKAEIKADGDWQVISPNVSPATLLEIDVGTEAAWKYCPDAGCWSHADGLRTNPVNVPDPTILVDPNTTVGTLIGKIGNGPIFKIGSKLNSQAPPLSGPLLARMNDVAWAYSDNQGKMVVKYTLCPNGRSNRSDLPRYKP